MASAAVRPRPSSIAVQTSTPSSPIPGRSGDARRGNNRQGMGTYRCHMERVGERGRSSGAVPVCRCFGTPGRGADSHFISIRPTRANGMWFTRTPDGPSVSWRARRCRLRRFRPTPCVCSNRRRSDPTTRLLHALRVAECVLQGCAGRQRSVGATRRVRAVANSRHLRSGREPCIRVSADLSRLCVWQLRRHPRRSHVVTGYGGTTLAPWFDVSVQDLSTVFPNLANFTSSNFGFLI
jgi:hypothetical protein